MDLKNVFTEAVSGLKPALIIAGIVVSIYDMNFKNNEDKPCPAYGAVQPVAPGMFGDSKCFMSTPEG